MATSDNGLAAVLYAASKVTAKAGNGAAVTLEEQTHYPFSDSIKLIIHTSDKTHFPIYLRIPGWCKKASVAINGKKQKAIFQPDSYARIENTWQDGDEIILHLPREIFIHKWAENNNSVSVNYGPLTFSLKIKENFIKKDPTKTAFERSQWQPDLNTKAWPAVAIYPESAWNYGLVLNDNNPDVDFKIVHKPWPQNDFPFTPQSVPIELIATGKKIPSWTIDENGLCGALPQSPVNVNTKARQVTLIPMGATRLRISAFPTVKGSE